MARGLVCAWAWVLLGLAWIAPAGAMDMCFVFFSHCDNNLEYLMVQDVNELLANTKALGQTNFNVWLMQDRHKGSFKSEGHTDEAITGHSQEYTGAMIYNYDRSSQKLAIIENLGERNVDDANLFKSFMVRAFKDCKGKGADTYILVMSDHGAGWYGFGGDEGVRRLGTARRLGGTGMTIEAIRGAVAGALADAGIAKLNLLGFDACLMAEYSALAAFHELADYYLASEATEPGHGWDYSSLDPSKAGVPDFAKAIIDSFALGKHGYWSHQSPKTLALYDFRKFPAFRTAARAAFNAITPALRERGDKQLSTAMTRARSDIAEFMGVSERGSATKGIADLLSFFRRLKDLCSFPQLDAAISTLEELNIYYKQGPGTPEATGTGVFFPRKRYVQQYGSQIYPTYTYELRTDKFIDAWNDVIAAYYSFQGSASGAASICGSSGGGNGGGGGGGSGPAPTPAPTPAPPPPGLRVTNKGCACQKEWTLRGYDQACKNYCCNPDSDSGGDWCFVEDPVCEGKSWAHCKPASTGPVPTTTTVAPTPAPAGCEGGTCCADAATTSFTLNGAKATCPQLASFCEHKDYGRRIRAQCPVTCDACCVTMVGHGSTVPAGTACATDCEAETEWGPFGWCWTSYTESEWGSCSAACWPVGFPTSTSVAAPATTRPPTTTVTTVRPTTTAPGPTTTLRRTTTTAAACSCVAVQHPSEGFVPAACMDHFNDGEIWCYVAGNAACDPPATPSNAVAGMAWKVCAAAETTPKPTTRAPTTTSPASSTTAPPTGCADVSYTGFQVSGNNASCSDLRIYCQHAEFGSIIQQRCPVTCGTCGCTDSETFVDAQGGGCSSWINSFEPCSRASEVYGYTAAQELDILANCRRACKLCTAAGTDTCTWAKDGECDEPTYCMEGTDCTDCGNCGGAAGGSPTPAPTTTAGPTTTVQVSDTCEYANDAICDEPTFCDWGTDCTDCQTCSSVAGDTCRWAKDGACDEPDWCFWGTDCTDCGNCGGGAPSPAGGDEETTTTTTTLAGRPSALDNSCYWANDGVCNDGDGLCAAGTDCTDCGTCAAPGSSGDTCDSALDGWCDEPLNCAHGTDCSDCGRCAAPPRGCVCAAVQGLPARCGDLLNRGDRPWCFLATASGCSGANTSTVAPWVRCESTGPGGHKESPANAWKPPAGCSCLAGHPLAATCQDRFDYGVPWCYVDPAGTCLGMRKDWVGTFVECQRSGSSGTLAGSTAVGNFSLAGLAAGAAPLLDKVHVTPKSTGGFDISAGLSLDAAEVQVQVNLVYRTQASAGRRLSAEAVVVPRKHERPRRLQQNEPPQQAGLFILELQSRFTANGFQAYWDGKVPYLKQGSKAARAHFTQEGEGSVSVSVVYFPLGITPRAVGGFYSSTGGRNGRMVLGLAKLDRPALYVEEREAGSMIAAVPHESGGLFAPVLSVREDGRSFDVLETLLAWGLPPEVPNITVEHFSLTERQPPVPFEVASIAVYADQDPPVSDFWEDSRQVQLDALGNVNSAASFPCSSHLDCGEQEYCWACDRCLALGSSEFCLNCASGGGFCGERKFCDCAAGGTCDSVDLTCPGVPHTGYALLKGAVAGEWIGSCTDCGGVRKAFTEHAIAALGVQASSVQFSFASSASGGVLVTAQGESTKLPTMATQLAAPLIASMFQEKKLSTTAVTAVTCAGCVACAVVSEDANAEAHICEECKGVIGCTLPLRQCKPACKPGFAPSVPTLTCQGSTFSPSTFACMAGATEAPKLRTTAVQGALSLRVSDPAAFVSSASAKLAMRRALANSTGQPEEQISIKSMTVARRLQAAASVAGTVNVEYTITVPEAAAPGLFATLSDSETAASRSTGLTSALGRELTSLGLGGLSAEVTELTVQALPTAEPGTSTSVAATSSPAATTTAPPSPTSSLKPTTTLKGGVVSTSWSWSIRRQLMLPVTIFALTV